MYDEFNQQWYDRFAWLPVRSTWSGKLIWFKKYYAYEYSFIKNNKTDKNRFIYTKSEYLLTILRNEEQIY